MSMSGSAAITLPKALERFHQPARYKVAYGGRGGGKSWGFARLLLLLAAARPLRILCAREIQKSIKDSVHQLLRDQVSALGLEGFYEVLNTEIRGANGSLFLFSGLSDQTAESIKSFEGIDICWVEEAANVSRKSWSVLIPTIRKPGSEIWVSFNPSTRAADTWQRFIVDTPPDTIIIKLNYYDNPWFSQVLEQERAHAEAKMPPDEYGNIWLGEPQIAVVGAIYHREIIELTERRLVNLPYDPMLKVHVVCDLGYNDSMAIAMVQRSLSEIRLIDYIEDSEKTLDWYSVELRKRQYNWGKMWLPHDGNQRSIQTGKSAIQIYRALGWDVAEVPNVPVETGIKHARMKLAQTYADKSRVARLIDCLASYRRRITPTGEPGEPVHDEYSHGADCYRYVALCADSMNNTQQQRQHSREVETESGSWMGS